MNPEPNMSWMFTKARLPYLAYTVCCVCKRVRLYGGVWLEWGTDEGYEVSHGLCPDCFRERYGEDAE